ncbi:hypothetical protein [Streptomyces shenzhenensis]|uniref:hypothetical protein n=1 Tax=Streptomyces shenzhenensis TaxID=943815 RepID=UPI00215DB2D2|nr:hypothetical protein [Streptomyces shenzhenensis]
MNAKHTHERTDPELAEALKAVPMTEAGVFDVSDLEGTRRRTSPACRPPSSRPPNSTSSATRT